MGSAYSENFEMKIGVHQGCVLPPLLFPIVVDIITKNAKRDVINDVLRANDLVLITQTPNFVCKARTKSVYVFADKRVQKDFCRQNRMFTHQRIVNWGKKLKV